MSPQIRVVALMVTASTIVYMDRTSISLAAPEIISEIGISETAMGGVFSAFYFAYTLFMIPAGWLSDRFGPRSTLSAGLFAAGVFTALTAVVGLKTLISLGAAYGVLFAVRQAFGAAAAPLYPACARLTANWFPPATTARVQAVIFGVTMFGSALLPLPLTPFMRDMGWQSAFLILGVVTAVIAGVWHMLAYDSPPDVCSTLARVREKRSMSAARSVLLSRNVVFLAVSYGAFSYFVWHCHVGEHV